VKDITEILMPLELDIMNADAILDIKVKSEDSSTYLGGAQIKVLPYVSDTDAQIQIADGGLPLSMQFKPSSMQAAQPSSQSTGATMELTVTLKPEEGSKDKAKNIHDTLEQYFQQAPQLSNEPIHTLADRAAKGAVDVKEGLREIYAAQHTLVVRALGGQPKAWSDQDVNSAGDVEPEDPLKVMEDEITEIKKKIASSHGAAAAIERAKLVEREEQQAVLQGLALRKVFNEENGAYIVNSLQETASQIIDLAQAVDQHAMADWQDVLDWTELSTMWAETKLFESACYAAYKRMCHEIMELSKQLDSEVTSAVSILGGSCKWDDTFEELHKRLVAAQSMLGNLQTDLSTKTINNNVVTQGELLELAQVVSHLQEENDMLWAKVKSAGQAMNEVHHQKNSEQSQGDQLRQDLTQQLEAERQELGQARSAYQNLVAEAQNLQQILAAKDTEMQLLKSRLEETSRLASQEDEAKLKKDRRMLTRELLEVESQLVQVLNEREQVRQFLSGDQVDSLDKDYWAPALAIVRERSTMHDQHQLLASSLQEVQLQNRSLAGQVVDLENQLMQATTSLATWNEAFKSGKLHGSAGN